MPNQVETFASLLRQHSKAKAISDGRLVHAHICHHGYDRNTFLGNCLIQMYGNCERTLLDARAVCDRIPNPNLHTWNILIKSFGQHGCLADAKRIFDTIPARDVVSWNITIAAFAQNGKPKEALNLFHQMQAQGVKPNDITLVCALRACTSLAALEEGERVHASIIDGGYEEDIIVGTATINMYSKCGSFDKARSMFFGMPHKNVVSWNTMIAAFVQNGCHKEALALLHQMQAEGISPTSATYVCALDACLDTEEGYKIHFMIVDNGLNQNVVVGTAIVNFYGKNRALPDAKNVFSEMQNRTVVVWNTMISVFSQNGHGKDALGFFQQLCSEGVKPNNITFICSLDVCADMTALLEGQAIHTTLAGSDWEQDVMVGTALVNMYGKCGSLHDARSIFDKIPQRNAVCWTAMIGACVQNGHNEDALDLFRHMRLDGAKPDNITFVFVVDACASLAMPEVGKEVHIAVVNSEHGHDVIVGNVLMKMYGKCGSVRDASMVFGRMPHQNRISWTSMMVAFTQNGHGKEALQLFQQMQLESVTPDNVAFVCALDACACLAALEEGRAIEAALSHIGHGEDAMTGSALIHMYGKCGSMIDVERVFDSMPCRDVVTWTAVITAFAQNGYGEEVVALFNRMQLEGIKPNGITFLCVLNACSHTGLVDAARHFFTSMHRNYGLTHSIDHYMCMVDILGRAGHLEEAQGLISDLSSVKVAGAWICLLSACRIHCDMERGQHAANRCFELDPRNDAPYVMLSNIYADVGRWNDVALVREAMLLD